MTTAVLVLIGVVINMAIGAGVWTAIDDKDQRLYQWYKSAPRKISWWVQPLILFCWPVGVFFWWKERRVR